MSEEIRKMTEEEFVTSAIRKLRKAPYPGIHTVYSGLNDAIRKYFAGKNPVEIVDGLKTTGKVEGHPITGGHMVYLPGEMPASRKSSKGDQALAIIVGDVKPDTQVRKVAKREVIKALKSSITKSTEALNLLDK